MGILELCTPYQPNHHQWMRGEDECRIIRLDPYKSKYNTVNNINVTVQITHNLNSPRVSHACDTRGVTHQHVCILDSTHVYTHTQYYTRVYVCMATVAIADY